MRDELVAFTGHGEVKFPDAGLLASSAGRGWSGIAAEMRDHPAGEIPDIVSEQLEITLALAGDGSASVTRRGDGERQEARVTTGALWLCPPSVREDSIRISGDLSRILHIYLPADRFGDLGGRLASRRVAASSVRYASGVDDQVLLGLGMALAAELAEETSGGRLLTDCLSLALVARLASVHVGDVSALVDATPGGLEPRRLRRVLDFIEDHIDEALGLEDLAAIACLSPFHFARAFKAAMGLPPHRYVASRRMSRAKTLLAAGAVPIAEIAYRCGFASVSSFGRAFKRASGVSPAAYATLN